MKKLIFISFILLAFSCAKKDCKIDYPIEQISIKIKKKNLSKIDSLRNIVVETMDASNVKIKFKAKVNGVKSKIRLKGDQYDHYDTERFSLRVTQKVKGKKTVYSIQHPKTRNYYNEWVFHQLLKKEGIAYLDYTFVKVKINKKERGTYAKEEHLSNSTLLAEKGFENGPIFRFDDAGFWAAPAEKRIHDHDVTALKKAPIKNYNNIDSSLTKRGDQLLKGFQNGTLPADSVFNMEQLGKLYALCDLTGARHALRWLNVVYYYNKTDDKLHPIGFDSNSGKMKGGLVITETYILDEYHGKIRNSEGFKKAYYELLNKIAEPSYLTSFIADTECELIEIEKMITADEYFKTVDLDYLEQNQGKIKDILSND